MALQAFRLMLGFGLSIPVLFATTNAWVLWFAIPLLVESLAAVAAASGAHPRGGR